MDEAGAIMAQMKLERKCVNLPGFNGTQPRNIGFCSKHEKHMEDVCAHRRGGDGGRGSLTVQAFVGGEIVLGCLMSSFSSVSGTQ